MNRRELLKRAAALTVWLPLVKLSNEDECSLCLEGIYHLDWECKNDDNYGKRKTVTVPKLSNDYTDKRWVDLHERAVYVRWWGDE